MLSCQSRCCLVVVGQDCLGEEGDHRQPRAVYQYWAPRRWLIPGGLARQVPAVAVRQGGALPVLRQSGGHSSGAKVSGAVWGGDSAANCGGAAVAVLVGDCPVLGQGCSDLAVDSPGLVRTRNLDIISLSSPRTFDGGFQQK